MLVIVFSFTCNHLKLRFEAFIVAGLLLLLRSANSPNLDQILSVCCCANTNLRALIHPETFPQLGQRKSFRVLDCVGP